MTEVDAPDPDVVQSNAIWRMFDPSQVDEIERLMPPHADWIELQFRMALRSAFMSPFVPAY